jgi:hypothetical protein
MAGASGGDSTKDRRRSLRGWSRNVGNLDLSTHHVAVVACCIDLSVSPRPAISTGAIIEAILIVTGNI